MHEQLISLLDLLATGPDPAARDVATALRSTVDGELVALRELRDRAGLPTTNIHAGHRMPGLLTPDDLAALTAAGDTRQIVDAVRAHAEQAVVLSRGEQTSGADSGTRELAAVINGTAGDRLARLNTLSAQV